MLGPKNGETAALSKKMVGSVDVVTSYTLKLSSPAKTFDLAAGVAIVEPWIEVPKPACRAPPPPATIVSPGKTSLINLSSTIIVYCFMDSTALNYNPIANVEIPNSCFAVVEVCIDSTSYNYNVNANVDDGSCIPFVYGCTDSTAFNYDSKANTEEGSCIPVF